MDSKFVVIILSTRNLLLVHCFEFTLWLLEPFDSVPETLKMIHQLLGGHPLQVCLLPLLHGGVDSLWECRLGFIFKLTHFTVPGARVAWAFVLCSARFVSWWGWVNTLTLGEAAFRPVWRLGTRTGWRGGTFLFFYITICTVGIIKTLDPWWSSSK